jgi:hypothetical protein
MLGAAANEALLGPAEGRIFYAGWEGAQDAIASFVQDAGGRVITETPLLSVEPSNDGAWLAASQRTGGFLSSTVGFTSTLAPAAWKVASALWAGGAAGQINAFVSATASDASYFFTVEAPILLDNPNVWSPIQYH